MHENEFSNQRAKMLAQQIRERGVHDPLVLNAMGRVRREAFLPPSLQESAYADSALPIKAQQTISQPYIVALMIAALHLRGGEKVLEIGTGSGYAAAVLAEIAGDVVTMERIAELAKEAHDKLSQQGYRNVQVVVGDGTLGWTEQAPYDAIIVAAGGPIVPATLKQQLKIGGRLVMPVGTGRDHQKLICVRRVDADQFETQELTEVRFVPLIGAEGWNDSRAE